MEQDSSDLGPIEDVFLQDDLGPSIAEHAMQCDNLFRNYEAVPDVTLDPTVIEDQLARFTLWTSNMAVFGPPNISLDYRLRYSPQAVGIIHQLLDIIQDSLTPPKPKADPPQTPSIKKLRISGKGGAEVTKRGEGYTSDDDSDEEQAPRDASLITFIIEGTLTRLIRLSNAVRKSANANRAHKIGRYTNDEEANNAISELRLYTECYIQFRFPKIAADLRSALVEANTLRLRRLYYQRSHRRRVALSVQRPQTNPTIVQPPEMADSTPNVNIPPSTGPNKIMDEMSEPMDPPPAPMTLATTRESAVGTLYPNSRVEIPHTKSVLVSSKLSLPPVPMTSQCPYCGVIVERKDTAETAWNDHVIRDLEPFICIFDHCTAQSQRESGLLTFETSRAWMNHMLSAHGYDAWECRAPSHRLLIFKREDEYQEHLREEHDVLDLQAETLSRVSRRTKLDRIQTCPFGDDFRPGQASKKVKPNSIFSSGDLQSHIAGHMKQIALLALQKLPSDNDDSAENVGSGQPFDDDGVGGSRESMKSVMKDGDLKFQNEAEDSAENIHSDQTFEAVEATKLYESMNEVQDGEVRNPQEVAKDRISNTHERDTGHSVEKLDLGDKEDRDEAGRTELHRAVLARDYDRVQSAIDKGANLRSKANDGRTALHYACLAYRLDLMRLLSQSGDKTLANLGDAYGQTPLHYAVKHYSKEMIKRLIKYGADMNMSDNYGLSPFIWATLAGEETIVLILLALGADVNSTSADGKSALAWAISRREAEMCNLLLEKGADVMHMAGNTRVVPLEEAAAYGDVTKVQMLLKYGADPNYRDREGWSALHWAAEGGHREIVDLLLKHGAEVNAVSSCGTSPLHCAANAGSNPRSFDLVEVLLQHGADPTQLTRHGWTPLHHAAFSGGTEAVIELLRDDRVKSRIAHQDNQGWSALHLAVHARESTCVLKLLKNSVNSGLRGLRDENGLTARDWITYGPVSHSASAFEKSRCIRGVTGLRQAVVSGNMALLKYVLEEGGRKLSWAVNDTDSGNRTALYYAAKMGQISIMNMLLAQGAEPSRLPTGLRTWDHFISDDRVLSRLRQAGYRFEFTEYDINEEMYMREHLRDGSTWDLPRETFAF